MTAGGPRDVGSGGGRGNARAPADALSDLPAALPTQPKVKIYETPPGSHRNLPTLDPNMPDDLTKIRRIDRQLAEKLRRIGITHYEQVAGWTATDVRSLSAALGLGRTVYQQNWIEQAEQLARRRATPTASEAPTAGERTQLPAGAREAAAPVTPSAPVAAAAAAETLAVVSPPEPEPDIRALVSVASTAIRNRDLQHLQSAAVTPPPQAVRDTDRPFREPLVAERIGDLELRQRVSTALSSIAEGAIIPVVGFSRQQSSPPQSRVGEVVAAVQTAAEGPIADAATEPLPQVVKPADELTLIAGMPRFVADRLNDLGITRFSEIAAFDADDVAALSIDCDLGNRVTREGWLEQAAALASGRMTKAACRERRGESTCLVPYPAQPLRRDRQLLDNLAPPAPPVEVMPSAPADKPIQLSPPQAAASPPAVAAPVFDLVSSVDVGPVPDDPMIRTLDVDENIGDATTTWTADPAKTGAAQEADVDYTREDPFPDGYVAEEAEVTIKPRSRADLEEIGYPRAEEEFGLMGRDAAVSIPGTLKSKLVKATDQQDVTAEDYAAYHRDIEEASVEIVDHQAIDRIDENDTSDPLLGSGARPSVGRFLKALRGR